ncbi:hypothetical protein BpHYR1_024348 [Brachionus plicatilis]|uniref:Uncharacterized protein n=1 Tax=Brachionus plicatilis TaxID=10195 RepID=A0A3M7RZU0_BRAPC|nr:hypothetical protein BpHYR1_024348 [Brachionus plicatilis]
MTRLESESNGDLRMTYESESDSGVRLGLILSHLTHEKENLIEYLCYFGRTPGHVRMVLDLRLSPHEKSMLLYNFDNKPNYLSSALCVDGV